MKGLKFGFSFNIIFLALFLSSQVCTSVSQSQTYSPPFSDARSRHSEAELDPRGIIKHAHSNSSISPTNGYIYHNSWVDSKISGGIGIEVSDGIYGFFSVPESGDYCITTTGWIEGGFWNVSSTFLAGAAEGAGILSLELQLPFSHQGKTESILHETDFSNGALLETLGETIIWSL